MSIFIGVLFVLTVAFLYVKRDSIFKQPTPPPPQPIIVTFPPPQTTIVTTPPPQPAGNAQLQQPSGVVHPEPPPATHTVLSGTTPMQIYARNPLTPTGVFLNTGTQFSVSASGYVSLSTDGRLPRMSPAGDGPCSPSARVPFVAPQLPCHSLIGRIGAAGPFFEVGNGGTFRADHAGDLFLGVNDNFFGDNSGYWTVSVTVIR